MKSFFDTIRSCVLSLAVAILLPLLVHWFHESVTSIFFTETYEQRQKLEVEKKQAEENYWKLKLREDDLRKDTEPLQRKKLEDLRLELDLLEKNKESIESKVKAMKEEKSKYDFYVDAFAGTVALVIGSSMSVASIGVGFLVGGLVLLIMGYFGYSDHLSHLFKFISVLIALLLVVFLSYRLNNKKE